MPNYLCFLRLWFHSVFILWQVASWASLDTTPEAAAHQVDALSATAASPDELSDTARLSAVNFANSIVPFASSSDVSTLNSVLRLLGAVTAQAVSETAAASVVTATAARLLRQLTMIHEHLMRYPSALQTPHVRRLLLQEPHVRAVTWPFAGSTIAATDFLLLPDPAIRESALEHLEFHAQVTQRRRLENATSSAAAIVSGTTDALHSLSSAALAGASAGEAPIVLSVSCLHVFYFMVVCLLSPISLSHVCVAEL